jgi:SH3-like domain-containing protein
LFNKAEPRGIWHLPTWSILNLPTRVALRSLDYNARMGPAAEKAIVWSVIALIGLFVLFLLALSVSGYPGL